MKVRPVLMAEKLFGSDPVSELGRNWDERGDWRSVWWLEVTKELTVICTIARHESLHDRDGERWVAWLEHVCPACGMAQDNPRCPSGRSYEGWAGIFDSEHATAGYPTRSDALELLEAWMSETELDPLTLTLEADAVLITCSAFAQTTIRDLKRKRNAWERRQYSLLACSGS